MNKKLIAVAMLASAALTSAAHAADGTINFTGNITDTACVVNTASANQNIPLGTVSDTAFSAAGDTAASKKVTITLESCPAAFTTASVSFDGTSDADNTNILALTSASTATGVGVALYEADGSTLIPLHTTSSAITLDTTAGAVNNLDYVAKYMSTATAVTAGTANASTDFTIVYN